MRVLVVEDETSLSQQLAAALSAVGYAVDCAADGNRQTFLRARRATMRLFWISAFREWTG
jgi:DNA-binding response OmpR family regulator